MHPRKTLCLSGIWLIAASLLLGCAVWQPQWPEATASPTGADTAPLMTIADRLAGKADDRDKLVGAIAAYEAVLAAEPTHYPALTSLANLTILLGAAYCDDRPEKIRLFKRAMRLSERAMVTHPEFRTRVQQGQPPWEACSALTSDQIDAMFFWVTAVLYYFKEGLTLPEMVVNVRWIGWCKQFLDRIETLDDRWGGGGVQFSLALCYGILPSAMGGDAAASAAYLDRAVTTGPDWLLNRWGRAKYFHVRDGNRQGFVDDLRWVVRQDIHTAGGVYPWKIYFQRDAGHLLENVDRYF